ncbi:MAG: hypothetical protein ABSD08_22270 [Xanthobacteraceae bacterium]|jgi:hypothetical protein
MSVRFETIDRVDVIGIQYAVDKFSGGAIATPVEMSTRLHRLHRIPEDEYSIVGGSRIARLLRSWRDIND